MAVAHSSSNRPFHGRTPRAAAMPWAEPLVEILELLPHRHPFRFVDALIRLDAGGAEGSYRFRPGAFYCQEAAPGATAAPGSILVETMAQIGIAAHGLYLLGLARGRDAAAASVMLFCDAEVELLETVSPGDEVHVVSELVFFRRNKIRSRIEMRRRGGRVKARATLSGTAVVRSAGHA